MKKVEIRGEGKARIDGGLAGFDRGVGRYDHGLEAIPRVIQFHLEGLLPDHSENYWVSARKRVFS